VIGRFLMDLVMKVPMIEPEDFEEMLNSNMKVMCSFWFIQVHKVVCF